MLVLMSSIKQNVFHKNSEIIQPYTLVAATNPVPGYHLYCGFVCVVYYYYAVEKYENKHNQRRQINITI